MTPRDEAERLLASLAGIVSAHVVTDATGRLVEIHILAAPELHPKQVVRNVESALSAGLGVEVDRRIVSVAQIRTSVEEEADPSEPPQLSLAEADPGAPAAGADPEEQRGRVEFVRYESRRDAGGRCCCDVILRHGEDEVSGTGKGADTPAGRAEAAARAVFDGLAIARPDVALELHGAVISAARGRRFVIVSAHTLMDRQTIPLAGAAVITRSPEEAAILAALQASNRWSS
ncbi:MAG: hypothetical protein P8177_06935 [Gemmatimonadota bacterium]